MTEQTPEGIGTFKLVAIDAEDADALADFYSKLTGMQRDDSATDDEWISLGNRAGTRICIQRVKKHVPPSWPDAQNGQQMHLDIYVADLEASRGPTEAIGARLVDDSHTDDFHVYLDPAGHPFCVCQA